MIDRRSFVANALAGAGASLLMPGSALPSLAAPRPRSGATEINLLVAGQSLGGLWRPGHSPALPSFIAELRATGDVRPVTELNVCGGADAALKQYAFPTKPYAYFWDTDLNAPGPSLIRAVRLIAVQSRKPNLILWVQGERDSSGYKGSSKSEAIAFVAAYGGAVRKILASLRAACGDNTGAMPVLIQRLGPRGRNTGAPPIYGSMDYLPGLPLVRIAQQAIARDPNAVNYWGAQPDETIPLRDGLHPTAEGYVWIGKQTADAVLGRL